MLNGCFEQGLVICAALAVFVSAPTWAVPEYQYPAPGSKYEYIHSHWLAPHTLSMSSVVGSTCESRVQWFDRSGTLLCEVRDADPSQVGFVSRQDRSGFTYVSIANPNWQMFLPAQQDKAEPPVRKRFLAATPDGRTLLCSTEHARQKLPVSFEMNVEGKRMTLGPYAEAPEFVHLDPSGALALHFPSGWWVITDRFGHEKYREMLSAGPSNRLIACNDRGALFGNFGWRRLDYRGFDGALISFPVSANVFCRWVGDRRALVHARDDSLLLIDCEKGRVVWTCYEGELGTKRVVSNGQSCGLLDRYLITAAVEFEAGSRWGDWPAVELHARDLESGSLVASWRDNDVRDLVSTPHFFEADYGLFLLWSSKAARVESDDILNGRNGWRVEQSASGGNDSQKH